mgnify:CR=1 FL=1
MESIVPYEHTEYGSNDFRRQPLLTSMLSPVGPVIATADVNGDNLVDIYAGGTIESPGKLFLQGEDGYFKPSPLFSFPEDINCTDGDACFFDADGDGDQDLYIASGGYHEYSAGDKALQDLRYIPEQRRMFELRCNVRQGPAHVGVDEVVAEMIRGVVVTEQDDIGTERLDGVQGKAVDFARALFIVEVVHVAGDDEQRRLRSVLGGLGAGAGASAVFSVGIST